MKLKSDNKGLLKLNNTYIEAYPFYSIDTYNEFLAWYKMLNSIGKNNKKDQISIFPEHSFHCIPCVFETKLQG